MEIHFSPELEKRLADISIQIGRPADELVQDVIAGYVDDLAGVRDTLDNRYDEIKSGKVKLIPGDEVEAYFREKSIAAQRAQADL